MSLLSIYSGSACAWIISEINRDTMGELQVVIPKAASTLLYPMVRPLTVRLGSLLLRIYSAFSFVLFSALYFLKTANIQELKHCMLLWKKPSAKPLQTQIDCAFDVFSVIRDLREEYSPHFYKANKKKTSQPIAWSADAFMEALKKNPVNKGNQLLGELGYSISMYSSQAESESLSFCATIGNQSSQFYDTIIINFPDGFFDEFEHVTVFADVFKQCTRIFQPYWGCIADTAFFQKGQGLLPTCMPSSVHWINFWSDPIFDGIGRKRIMNVFSQYDIVIENGVFMIQTKPTLCPCRTALLNAALGISSTQFDSVK